MKHIYAYIGYNERHKIHYRAKFEIVEELPKIGDIISGREKDGELTIVKDIYEVSLDCEQGDDEVHSYNYYKIVAEFRQMDENDEWQIEQIETHYIAIKK